MARLGSLLRRPYFFQMDQKQQTTESRETKMKNSYQIKRRNAHLDKALFHLKTAVQIHDAAVKELDTEHDAKAYFLWRDSWSRRADKISTWLYD